MLDEIHKRHLDISSRPPADDTAAVTSLEAELAAATSRADTASAALSTATSKCDDLLRRAEDAEAARRAAETERDRVLAEARVAAAAASAAQGETATEFALAKEREIAGLQDEAHALRGQVEQVEAKAGLAQEALARERGRVSEQEARTASMAGVLRGVEKKLELANEVGGWIGWWKSGGQGDGHLNDYM